jgi:hypothetical protein
MDPLVGWTAEIDRHATSPRPRRTVMPPSKRPTVSPTSPEATS